MEQLFSSFSDKESICLKAFATIGAVTTSYLALKLLKKVCYVFKMYVCPSSVDFSKFGTWSVITGSTDGIGKAIAFELASRGQNIILLARNTEKLNAVSQEIASKYNVQVVCLKVDFSDDESIYDEIEELLEDKDIGVLVNNVGMASPLENFLEIPNLSDHIRSISRVNMISLMKMHQIVLPGMVARGRGLIVNVSSGTALRPMFPIYGGTKTFVDYFSQALDLEYADKGVTVQCCMPFLVSTKMVGEARNSPLAVSPESFAKGLMRTSGKERRTHAHAQHAFLGWLTRSFPDFLFEWTWKRSVSLRGDRKKKQ